MKSIAEIFCTNIRARREQLGLTQEAVAERMGISPGGYRQLEGGKNWIAKETPARIAKALHCSEIDLFRAPESGENPLRTRVLRKLAALPDHDWQSVEALIDGLIFQGQAQRAAAKKPKPGQLP